MSVLEKMKLNSSQKHLKELESPNSNQISHHRLNIKKINLQVISSDINICQDLYDQFKNSGRKVQVVGNPFPNSTSNRYRQNEDLQISHI